VAESKRHHFVPQMIQNRFVDDDGILHIYRKESDSFYSAAPMNNFIKGRLHTATDREGKTDDELEQFFSQLESIVAPFIEKAVSAARQDRAPDVDSVEKENWDGFAYYQVKRTPDFHDQIVTVSYVENRIREARAEMLERMPHRSHEIERVFGETKVPEVLQNARVNALGNLSENVMQALSKRGMTILRIDPKIRSSFIIGSAPVARLEPGGLKNPAGEWWLPVAPDVAIGLTPNQGQVQFMKIADARIVRHLNIAISGQSASYGSHSMRLLKSLAYRR
jgi:hypothetical protein